MAGHGPGRPTPRQPSNSVERTLRRQLAFYERLRRQTDLIGRAPDDPLRAAVDRAWEAVYAVNLALESRQTADDLQAADAASDAPPEVCNECGKVLGLRDVAHVLDDRCLCMGCYCTIKASRDREETGRLLASRRPTEQQVAYARSLGLRFPPDVSYQDLSEMVRAYLTRPAPPQVQHEAAAMGVPEVDTVSLRDLERRLDDHRIVCRWVYSVCRHMLAAEWETFADSRLPHNAVIPIVTELISADGTLEAIRAHPANRRTQSSAAGANGQATPAALPAPGAAAATGNGHAKADGAWCVFDRNAANGRTARGAEDVYGMTRRLIERELWAYLPHLPKRAVRPRRGKDRVGTDGPAVVRD